MKIKIIKTVLVVIFIITSSSFADINIGGFASFNDASDLDETLIGIGGKIEYDINPQFSLDFRMSYEVAENDYYYSSDYYGYNYHGTVDVALLPIVFSFNWNIPVSDQLIPYVGAGVGFYIPLQDIDDADTEFGGNIHGGLKLQISEDIQFFGEAKYRILDMDGADMGGFGVIGGISFGMPGM